MEQELNEKYEVSCYTCKTSFNALEASWCGCLSSERTLICPKCRNCFCRANSAYKERFWASAPQGLWDVKLEEHKKDFRYANPGPNETRRPLVLIVEDEKEIQKVAVRDVEAMGYGVVLAENGMEGLELARLYHPNLILSDALMPRMDGREMCRKIKADQETADIKVIIMTSLYTQSKYKTEAYREFRVDDYLTKPLDYQQLSSTLKKYLG